MRRLSILAILLFAASILKAQYYQTGVEPFSVSWRQISDGRIRLIYPSTAETIAPKYLQLLTLADSLAIIGNDVGSSKIDIILHNHSVLSNGFVAWAPRRMELIAQPSYNGYAQQWHKQLAIHEMRHVKQMYALNRSTVKFASYLFGQQATGLAAGFVPLWFLEGDAVATETAMSESGRGRSASFYRHYRALLLSNPNTFKYDKWLMGSYRDYIPNHYNFGYQIVTYGNLKYGDSLWANTLNYVSRKPYTLFPFYFGLKKKTGLSRKNFAQAAFAFQDSIWTINAEPQNIAPHKPMLKQSEDYTNYTYPYPLNDSTILAYKTSLGNIPAFVEINLKTQEQKVTIRPGELVGKPFINDSLIVWAEYKPHIRWDYKNYGQIVKYNFKTKQKQTLNRKRMLGSPIYNNLSRKVVCLEYSDSGHFALVSINNNREYQREMKFPDNIEPFELTIDSKNGNIYVAATNTKGKEVFAISSNNTLISILGPTYNDINSIAVTGDSLFFTASANQCENIYYHNIKLNKTYRLVNSRFGANYSTLQKNYSIMFSEYTPKGYTICTSSSNGSTPETDIVTLNDDPLTLSLSQGAKANIDTVVIQEKVYKSERYRGIGTLFNFHSWAPVYFDPYEMSNGESVIKPGATVISQNLTGSTVLTLGYGYSRSHLFKANLRYSGFWPVFSASYELYDDYAYLYQVNQTTYQPKAKRTKARLYTYLPFTLSENNLLTYFHIFNSLEITNDYLFDESAQKYRSGLLQMSNGAYFYALRNQSHRDLLPRFGTVLIGMLVNSPNNTENLGTLRMLKATAYIPGIGINHHIKIEGAIQKQSLKKFYFSNKVDPPRGYSLYQSEKFKGFSADYLFPLAYPDWVVGSMAYIKRFSVNLFYDYAENTYPTVNNNKIIAQKYYMQSVGFELNIDMHFFRTRYPFRLKYCQAFTGNSYKTYSGFSLVYDIYSGAGNSMKHKEL